MYFFSYMDYMYVDTGRDVVILFVYYTYIHLMKLYIGPNWRGDLIACTK